MEPERWQRLRELFDAARELAPERREEFVRQECPADPELVRQVVTLHDWDPLRGDPRFERLVAGG